MWLYICEKPNNQKNAIEFTEKMISNFVVEVEVFILSEKQADIRVQMIRSLQPY
jgi:hypothetical protein